jgi:hypothetical protein
MRREVRRPPRAAVLLAAFGLLPGCGAATEAVSLSFKIDDQGAMVSVLANTSAVQPGITMRLDVLSLKSSSIFAQSAVIVFELPLYPECS